MNIGTRTITILALLLAVLTLASSARAQRAIPDEFLAQPLALVLPDRSAGTGFFVNGARGQYLVTAKHVLYAQGQPQASVNVTGYGVDQKDSTPFQMVVDLNDLARRGLVIADKSDDIALVMVGVVDKDTPPGLWKRLPGGTLVSVPRLPVPGVSPQLIKRFDEVLISNDVLIFGYPTSLGLAPQLDHARPLLRSGIVAGKNEQNKTIIIDCPAYRGNSGGPVVQIQTYADRRGLLRVFTFIGVVTQFVPAAVVGNTLINSGYTVVVPMDRVLETVERLEKKP